MRRATRRSIHCSGSKFFTSHANVVAYGAGSNAVTGPAPPWPATTALHEDAASLPSGLTEPIPVTTTLGCAMGEEPTAGVGPEREWTCGGGCCPPAGRAVGAAGMPQPTMKRTTPAPFAGEALGVSK